MRNVDEVVLRMTTSSNSLDVGGWHRPIRGATHVIDINDYDSRLDALAWDPDAPQRFSEDHWVQRDICNRAPWPWPDDYFDFVCCSHVLEDIRDPIWVTSEISRVGKAGYIECPTPALELLMFCSEFDWILNKPRGSVGSAHHRWFVACKTSPSRIVFRLKPHDLVKSKRYVPYTRFHTVDYGKKADGFFWEGGVEAKEEIFDIGKWIDNVALMESIDLVSFSPIRRIQQKLGRASVKSQPVAVQPRQNENGVRYPYY